MDEQNINAAVDNSRLEELLSMEITPEMQEEFFEILKDSQLYMPVEYSSNIFDELENAKEGDVIEPDGHVGFNILYLTDENGNKAVPLYTSPEMFKSTGIECSAYVLFMSDLADMLGQTDKYSLVTINPLTEHDIVMPVEAFLGLFEKPSEELEKLQKFLDLIKEYSVELEENTTLFIRSDDNLMIDDAVDGVFTARAPFYASSNPKYREDLKYTNILLMPKGKRILALGPERDLDIVIAPGTSFNHEDTMDGTTNLWMCGDQPFFDG